jgi:non-specific serine/threonine protein kinase
VGASPGPISKRDQAVARRDARQTSARAFDGWRDRSLSGIDLARDLERACGASRLGGGPLREVVCKGARLASTSGLVHFVWYSSHTVTNNSQGRQPPSFGARPSRRGGDEILPSVGAPNNLPEQLTGFIGRRKELAELVDRAGQHRLVTVVGTGGTGKTRLVLEAAARLLDQYTDGSWLVDFTPFHESRFVGGAIAAVFGVSEHPHKPIEQSLIDQIGNKRVLLVLDNCEHLVDSIASVARLLLTRCRGLGIVATSREALRVPGEALWWILSMGLPLVGTRSDVGQMSGCDSVQLFLDRARLEVPGFGLTKANAAPIAAICRQVDGIPLAIELAAALVSVMSPQEIATELSSGLNVLVSGSKRGIERHQTLEKAIDWSYQLLTPQEAVVFPRLSVFAGAFSQQAAKAVCADTTFTSEVIQHLLLQLVRKSMVQAATPEPGNTRYRLHEILREFGRAKLRESGLDIATQRRHLDYMVALVEDAYETRMASGSESALQGLMVELDNIRAALAYSMKFDSESGLRLAGAAREVWFARGQSEGRRWLGELIATSKEPTRNRARALCTAGILAAAQQDDDAAWTLLSESHRLFAELGDQVGRAWAAQSLGEALLVVRMDADGARGWLDEALAVHEKLGNRFGAERAIGSLGLCAAVSGNYVDSIEKLNRSFRIALELHDVWGEAFARTFLGWIAMMQRDLPSAQGHLRGAVRTLADARDPMLLATSVEGYAGCVMESDPRTAVRLAAAGTAIRDRIGNRPARPAVDLVASVRSRAVAALGPGVVEREWRSGLEMSVDEVVQIVLGTSRSTPTGALSRREEEIARLVAEGLTSRAIAMRLHLSERTVENHVEHILNKLGLRNRTQIAAWALKELSTRD